MRDDAVLVDSSILIYALGDPHPARDSCRRFLREATSGNGRAYASVEMFQETLRHRMRRTGDRAVAITEIREAEPMFITLNFDHEVLERALDLIEHSEVRGRDAVHAANALTYGIETIASTDAAFDGVRGLRRLDPTSN